MLLNLLKKTFKTLWAKKSTPEEIADRLKLVDRVMIEHMNISQKQHQIPNFVIS